MEIRRGGHVKAIAVDIDNVLNNFSQTLAGAVFEYNESYGLSHADFDHYLDLVKRDIFDESEFLTTKVSDFRYRIHEQCYGLAQAKRDGVEFMQWLKANDWKVIICTKRDLRLAVGCTKKWLEDNHIPYDYLCMVLNKVVFCKLWDVPYLIDDDMMNITYGEQYGIKVYYPILEGQPATLPSTARGFQNFEEIKPWIQK